MPLQSNVRPTTLCLHILRGEDLKNNKGIGRRFSVCESMKTYTFQCCHCGTTNKRDIKHKYKKELRGQKNEFCSVECFSKFQDLSADYYCAYCGKIVKRSPGVLRKSKSGRVFCNSSCAASYNNKVKRKSRRSKCEIMLLFMLQQEFPDHKFVPNNKTMLDGYEIDIAIPSLSLGIEWNGIVHFKPIYGQARLSEVQKRDQIKREIAQKKGITLIVVPDLVSTKARVREAFIEIAKFIRSQNLRGLESNQPIFA